MFPLAIRLWHEGEMIYPLLFSVKYDVKEKKSSIRTFIKTGEKTGRPVDFSNYMIKTPWTAVNGQVFEQDILLTRDAGGEHVGMVWFDELKGQFFLWTKDGNLPLCDIYMEIIGNIYEDREMAAELMIPKEFMPEELPVKSKNDKKTEPESTKEPQKAEAVQEKPQKQNEKEPKKEEPKKTAASTNPVLSISPAKEREETKAPKKLTSNIMESILINRGEKTAIEVVLTTEQKENIYSTHILYQRNDKKEEMVTERECDDVKKQHLMAALAVLKKITGKFDVTVSCNIPFIITPFENGWIKKWKDNDWKKDNGTPVQYSNLWQELAGLSVKYNVIWKLI